MFDLQIGFLKREKTPKTRQMAAFQTAVFQPDNLTTHRTGPGATLTSVAAGFSAYPNTSQGGGLGGASLAGTRIVENPANTFTTVTSKQRVKPLPRDFHLKMSRGDFLFAMNTIADMNSREFSILPLWYLNFELEQAARAKAARLGMRKRPHDDEWSEQFPKSVDEFAKVVGGFGMLENTLAWSDQQHRFLDSTPYRSHHTSNTLLATISHRGRVEVANYWGHVQNGDELGFAAVMTRGLYDKMYDADGGVVDDTPTRFDFLQLIPVWSREGQFASHLMPFRPEHFTKNAGMGSLSYETLVRMPTFNYEEKTDAETEFRSISFGKSKQNSAELEIPQFEIGHYIKVGKVLKTNTKLPQDHEIKRALRDFNSHNLLKKRCTVTLHAEPSLPGFKLI